MFDGDYGDPALVIVDPVDHAVITAASAVQSVEA